jgi:hypothetical protein
MQWIKRNLFLVVGGIVALGLLGFAGFYLFTKIQQDQSVTGELDAATQKLEALAKRDPYPNPENIAAAADEAKRVHGFLGDMEKYFLPAPYPEELNNMTFRTYLDNTRARLLGDAQRAGVEVPTNYWFTFSAQKGSMTFAPASLQPLASQLADIRMICEVLFDAKVNSLISLKRAPVDSQDSSLGSQDYLTAKGVTNNWSVAMPYEVAFQGFSSELAAVLEGFRRLPHCYIITNLVAEPAAAAAAATEEQSTPDLYSRYGLRPPMGGADSILRERYGGRFGGGRYGGGPRMMQPMPQPLPQPVRPVSRGPQTVLDEKPLRFTLSVQSIKLKAQAQTPPRTQPPTRTAQNAVP